jgi:integrase
MPTTTQILVEQRRSGRHPRSADKNPRVSTSSFWNCEQWVLDPVNRRLRPSQHTIRWSVFPPELVPEFKELLWSAMVSRPEGPPVAISRAANLSLKLVHLARWMHRRKLNGLAQLTPAAVSIYVNEVKAILRRFARKRDGDLETVTVATMLQPLALAFQQRAHMRAAGFKPMKDPPFGEGTAWSTASDIVEHVDSFTPPLPDAVVIPIITRATELIHAPAEEIIRLQSVVTEALLEDQRSKTSQYRRLKKQLGARATAEHRNAWWTAMRLPGCIDDEEPANQLMALRRATHDLIAACVLVIRFQTGIRHGEIFSWKPSLDEQGMPTCITISDSVSGVYELFFANGTLEKGVDTPVPARWLLAGRIKGDAAIPHAVRALQVLNRIYEPWRLAARNPELEHEMLLQFSTHGFPSQRDQILPMRSNTLAELMKAFYANQVDLASLADVPGLEDYAKGRIQSRQWRKTWANFIFRTNSKLLPAIAQQFQHASTALTQEAYIGKDPVQLGLAESAAMERAAGFVRRALNGETGLGGGMRKVVDDLHDLKLKTEGLTVEGVQEKTRTWLQERAIRVWNAPHGKCFVGLLPEESRCHQASETTDWANVTPNFINRSPRLCSGCKCFAIDEDDVPFWIERYFSNKRVWDEAVQRHMEVHYVVAQERYEQSERLLRSVGVEVSQLKEEEVAAGHYA